MNMPALLEFVQAELHAIHGLLDAASVPRLDDGTDEPLSLAQRVEHLTGLHLARNAADAVIARARCA